MKFLAPGLILCVATGVALAQQQEEKMVDRLLKAPDPKALSTMQNKVFSGSGPLNVKSFDAGRYHGVKSAQTKAFNTKSFLGIKNPWLGKTVFDTNESQFASRTDRNASKGYGVKTAETKDFAQGRKSAEPEKILPGQAAPRPYLVRGAAQGAMNKFTENLQKELTIDEVRELLNKSH